MLDARSREEVAEMLGELSEGDRRRLLGAMRTVEAVFERGLKFSEPFVLRGHEPGDMGWVVHRHGALYAREYGWDETFEALVARIVADFIDGYDPKRERCWIAEVDGERVGCVFVVEQGDAVAKLRLLLVEPEARGLGLGNRLVEECIRFAGNRGYEKLTLWTNSVLGAAGHIYEQHGFKMLGRRRAPQLRPRSHRAELGARALDVPAGPSLLEQARGSPLLVDHDPAELRIEGHVHAGFGVGPGLGGEPVADQLGRPRFLSIVFVADREARRAGPRASHDLHPRRRCEHACEIS